MTRDESRDDLDLEQRRARRREFRQKKESTLNRYRQRLDSFEEDLDGLDPEAAADLYAKMSEVRRGKQKLRGQLQELHDASDTEWDGVREEFDDSWDEFHDDLGDLSHYVEGRIDHSEDEF